MGLIAWLGLEPVDVGVFIISDILGFIAGMWFMPNQYLAVSASILISYHLFLAWLVITADRKGGLSMPVFSTIFTHLACLVLVFCCFMLTTFMGRPEFLFIPFLGAVRYCIRFCIPALAVFERGWLFSGRGMKRQEETTVTVVDPAIAAVHAAATGDDYDAWQRHLASRNPLSRKPGTTLKDEYEQFMVARVKARAAASPSGDPA